MAKTTRFGLILALLAAPLRAATVRVDAVEAAPAPLAAPSFTAPLAVSPAALAVSPLTAAPALAAAAPLAAPVAAPAALQAPAAAAAAAAAPASPASNALRALPAAADGPAKAPPADASDETSNIAGRALFDQAAAAPARPLSDIVKENSSRPLRAGVFIQQEHEGSLLSPDPKDSSGNVFRYYRPVEMRPDLTAEVDAGLGGVSRFFYNARKAFKFQGRGTPEAAWRAWPLSAKLAYLDKLDAATTAEKGKDAAWNGKVSLIMERAPGAPDFVTKNPHMEPPPEAYKDATGARFLQPEIVSAKEKPAASVGEALGRAKMIIAETGHAGVQFHVFIKAKPEALLAQMDSLDGVLQLVNDALFAKAAAGSDVNITHASLQPWHRGRSERVRALLGEASGAAHVPEAGDADSEKHAFVGFRYWGKEGENAVVSLELRGASLPWKRARQSMVQGMDTPSKPERDYEEARAYLTFLSLYAEAVAAGRAPRVPVASAVLDEAAAEASLRATAAEMGMPESAYDGLQAFARRMTGSAKTPAGYLFPFAASAPDSPELKIFRREVLVLAARAKAADEAGQLEQRGHARFLFWNAYKEWAGRFGSRQDARLAALVRSVAAN